MDTPDTQTATEIPKADLPGQVSLLTDLHKNMSEELATIKTILARHFPEIATMVENSAAKVAAEVVAKEL